MQVPIKTSTGYSRIHLHHPYVWVGKMLTKIVRDQNISLWTNYEPNDSKHTVENSKMFYRPFQFHENIPFLTCTNLSPFDHGSKPLLMLEFIHITVQTKKLFHLLSLSNGSRMVSPTTIVNKTSYSAFLKAWMGIRKWVHVYVVRLKTRVTIVFLLWWAIVLNS